MSPSAQARTRTHASEEHGRGTACRSDGRGGTHTAFTESYPSQPLRRTTASHHLPIECPACPLPLTTWPRSLAQELGSAGARHRVSPLVTCNGTEYIGRTPQLTAWVKTVFDVTASIGNRVLYTRMANKAYRKYIDSHKHPHCYLDLAVGTCCSRL